ncbi:MAG: hypothetical protein ACKVP3_13995 [Hyphomicrobiaceae bacterium]
MTSFATTFLTSVFLIPVAIGYFSSERHRAIMWAVILMILGMLYGSLRVWWLDIPDPLGRMPNDRTLQFELVQMTLLGSLAYVCLAAFGFWIRNKMAQERDWPRWVESGLTKSRQFCRPSFFDGQLVLRKYRAHATLRFARMLRVPVAIHQSYFVIASPSERRETSRV